MFCKHLKIFKQKKKERKEKKEKKKKKKKKTTLKFHLEFISKKFQERKIETF